MSEFLDNNKEELNLLADRVRELRDIMTCDSLKEMQSRQHTINIIDGWIEELFGVTKKDFHNLVDEDNIYKNSEDRSNSED